MADTNTADIAPAASILNVDLVVTAPFHNPHTQKMMRVGERLKGEVVGKILGSNHENFVVKVAPEADDPTPASTTTDNTSSIPVAPVAAKANVPSAPKGA